MGKFSCSAPFLWQKNTAGDKRAVFFNIRLDKKPHALAFYKSSLNDVLAFLPLPGFFKAFFVEQFAAIFKHGRAAANHKAVCFDIERGQADITKQLATAK